MHAVNHLCEKSSCKPSTQQWFNQNAFAALPSLYAANGSMESRVVAGSCSQYWDLSLIKDTSFRDTVRMRLQLNAFNLFNRKQFCTPNVNPTASQDDTITSHANSPRTIQVGVKLSY